MTPALTALTHLKRIRRAAGLSQAELGRRAGFDQRYISQLERGLAPSAAAHVTRLAKALEVGEDALSAAKLTIVTKLTIDASPQDDQRKEAPRGGA